MKPADPSPKEIAERGLEIQSAWTPDERQRRLRVDQRPMVRLADRLKAGIGIEKPIAVGVLKIKAKIGELLPAKSAKETGRGKKTPVAAAVVFTENTIAAYRKIAANVARKKESR